MTGGLVAVEGGRLVAAGGGRLVAGGGGGCLVDLVGCSLYFFTL